MIVLSKDKILPRDDAALMEQHSGGPVSLINPYDREGSGSRTMLGEREGAQVAPEVGLRTAGAAVSKRFPGLAAVAASWQLWRKEEAKLRCVAAKALAAVDAWRAAEERHIVTEDAAGRAEGRAREAFVLAERARIDGHPRQAITARRMKDAKEELWRAIEVAGAAEDAFFEAGDVLDELEDAMEAAEDTADAARARLRDAEKRAAWLRAVAMVGRQRAAWRAGGATHAVGDTVGDTSTVGGGAASGVEGTVGSGAKDGDADHVVAQAAAQVAAAQVAARAQVAREAAAVGAARLEAKWTALARETWQAALARDEQAAAANEREAAAAVEREVREAAVAWAAARKVVLNGAAGLTETANGRHEVAVVCELCGPGRWRWSWRGRGARGGTRGAEMRRQRWEPCRRRERRRPWESRIARGDDGGSWRQFDPGG